MAFHYKEVNPQETIARIKGILEERGISINERWIESGLKNCFSVRVTVAGTNIGTNGKGISRELALASGYAEFMERFQSGRLLFINTPTPSDVELSVEDVLTQSEVYLQCLADSIYQKHKKKVTLRQLAELIASPENKKITCQKYRSIQTGEELLIPEKLLSCVSISNGLCAGNSYEEAIVQGFSEVVERYFQTKIIKEKIAPPAIPLSELEQYDISYQIIKEIERNQYHVVVKDCSCGCGFPVIAVVVIDKNNHTYHVHYGAHPVFEIALERALTETLQGRNIKKVYGESSFIVDGDISYGEQLRSYVMAYSIMPTEFFSATPSYYHKPFTNHKNASNKNLYQYICEFAHEMGWRIYVKDYSVLAFPTYRVVVPGISDITSFQAISESSMRSIYTMQLSAISVLRNMEAGTKDAFVDILNYDKAMNISKNPIKYTDASRLFLNIGNFENIALFKICVAFAAWELKDTETLSKTINYLMAFLKGQNVDKKKAEILRCMKLYLDCSCNGRTVDDIRNILLTLYSEEIVDYIISSVVQHLNPFRCLIPNCNTGCKQCEFSSQCNMKQRDYLQTILEKHGGI